jgi:hypothetical protein
MSLKKSDNLARRRPATARDAWWRTLKSNAPLPLVLLLLIPTRLVRRGADFGSYNQRVVMLIGFNIVLAVSLQLINGFSGQFSLATRVSWRSARTWPRTRAEPLAAIDQSRGVVAVLSRVAGVCAIPAAALYGLFQLLRLTRARFIRRSRRCC